MGSGTSKSKNAKNKPIVVAADVVIPGQSNPVKVKGHVQLSEDGQSNGGQKSTAALPSGPAQVKQVAPNTYSLQMGEQNVGTFDVPDGDFASYLANASELTITNVHEEEVEDSQTGATSDNGDAPIHIQLSTSNSPSTNAYSDDEDWEEVIDNLDSQTGSASTSDDATEGSGNEPSERKKTNLKRALKKKRAKLSQEEYEQMIANHKQEVELMNLLREKEKDRQKYSLASKVAERKRKRLNRKAEMIEKEGLKHGQGAENNKRLQELQKEIEKTESEFKQEMTSKNKMMTGAESEVIMAAHKRKMQELQEEMKSEEERRTLLLADKLADRKERRRKLKAEKDERNKILEETKSAENTQNSTETTNRDINIQNQIEEKRSKFQSDVENKRKQLSDEEYKRLLTQHNQEVERLERTIGKSTDRQKQTFYDKLLARRGRRKRGEKADRQMTAAEIEELSSELERRQTQFEAELQEKRHQLSEEEYKQLIETHKRELTAFREKLDLQRRGQRQTLLEKLAARRAKKGGGQEEEPMTANDVQELQLALNQLNLDFKTELKEAKQSKTSQQDCQAMIDEHKMGMEGMQQQLEKEKQRMQNALIRKMEARKKSRENSDPMSQEEIKQLQLAMDVKEAAFHQELKAKKGKVSEKELQALINQHRKDQEKHQQLLDVEKRRMEQTFKDKLASRRKYKMPSGGDAATAAAEKQLSNGKNEQMDIEQINQMSQEIMRRKAQLEEEQREMRPLLNDEEYKQLIETHKQELRNLQDTLDVQRRRQHQSLLDKLAARRAKKGAKSSPSPLSSDEVKELQLALNQKAVDFRQELTDAKKSKSSEEAKKMMDAHKKDMVMMQQQLDEEKAKMQAGLMAKLEARRKIKNNKAQTTQEEVIMSAEDIKQLQLLVDKKDSDFKEELRAKKGKVSNKEYQKIIDEHNSEMDDLKNMLDREKLRMEKKLKDKLAARRKRPESASVRNQETDMINQEVKDLERSIELKMANLTQDAKQLRPLLSNEEYDQLLAQHKKELLDLKNQLDAALGRQKQHFQDKLAARRLRRKRLENEEEERQRLQDILDNDTEPMTEEEFNELQDDIDHYNTLMTTKIHSQRGDISQAQRDKLITEHRLTIEAFNTKLERYRQRMGMVLGEKLAARRLRVDVEDEEDSTDDEDSNGSEDEDQLGDLPDPVAISATTTLWTTPTQSSVLAVVPLKEEYPIRRKRQLYTNPAIFKHLDAHAIRLAQTASLVTQPSFSALVNELTRIGTTELEKVRLIFRWITAQNCEEMDLADAVNDTPLGVLKGLYYAKITFPTLFMRMCRFVGLSCVEICGCAKLKNSQPGQLINLKDYSFAHTWNAVRIDGYWHFVDCNWGVSHIPGSVNFDPFRFEYDEHYFLADPDVIIKTHFPNDQSWQLLMEPINIEQFNAAVPLKPDFFKFGFELLNHQKAFIEVPNGDLDIRFKCPVGFILYCKLSTVEGGREVSLRGTHFSQYVFIHQMAEDTMACYIRIPEPGYYYATFYAKQQFVDDELNLESQTEICKYYVRNHAPSGDQEPLPISPADHWGPVGLVNAGLTPHTHLGGVMMCQDGSDIDIRFKKTKTLKFIHNMTANGLQEQQLAPYSIQRDVNEEMVITICPPRAGRYGLHLFTVYPGVRPIHLCSYLIVVPAVRPVLHPIPLPPTGEEYGPSIVFGNLGVGTFTHPDPFIRTCAETIQVILSLSQKVTLNYNLIHDPPACKDLSSTVQCQFDGRSMTYHLVLNQPGYYHFRLEGKDGNVQQMANVVLYNYLIRKD